MIRIVVNGQKNDTLGAEAKEFSLTIEASDYGPYVAKPRLTVKQYKKRVNIVEHDAALVITIRPYSQDSWYQEKMIALLGEDLFERLCSEAEDNLSFGGTLIRKKRVMLTSEEIAAIVTRVSMPKHKSKRLTTVS